MNSRRLMPDIGDLPSAQSATGALASPCGVPTAVSRRSPPPSALAAADVLAGLDPMFLSQRGRVVGSQSRSAGCGSPQGRPQGR
jgi:hypothetical protein